MTAWNKCVWNIPTDEFVKALPDEVEEYSEHSPLPDVPKTSEDRLPSPSLP